MALWVQEANKDPVTKEITWSVVQIWSSRKSDSPWDSFTSLLGPAPKARNPEPVIKSRDNSILLTMLRMSTSVSLNECGNCDFPLSGQAKM